MWRILATAILLFYVSPITARKICDLVNLKVCISNIKKNPTIEPTNYCKHSQENKSCYQMNHCTKDGAYSDVLKEVKKNCDKQSRRLGPVTTTTPTPKLNPRKGTTVDYTTAPKCNRNAVKRCSRKLHKTDECDYWQRTKRCYQEFACLQDKYYHVLSKIKKYCSPEAPTYCDPEDLTNCRGKIDEQDSCTYWKQKQGCYKTAGCGGEEDYPHVLFQIKEYCRIDPRKAVAMVDCDSNALTDCSGKIDQANSCTSAKGKLECYMNSNCFNDYYKHDEMEKEMKQACDLTCKMRSSCLVLVVMLALIKYLD